MGHAVLVVGAGYAGVTAANQLAGAAEVTVVDPREEFVERIRLHRLVAGSGPATVPLSRVLDPRVRTRTARVTRIGDGVATLDDGGELRFDRLVYAVGSGGATGPAGAGYRVDTLEAAARLRDAVAGLGAGAVVTVVGGGLTGIETATELAAARPDLVVRLVTDGEVATGMGAPGQERVRARLRELGIGLREHAAVGDPAGLGADVVVWATAPGVPDLARRSGLPVDDSGRLRVDATLTSVGDPRVVGAGDAVAAPPEVGFVRASCQAAIPLGTAVARTVRAGLRGRPAPVASIGYQAQCLALGPGAGLVQLVDRRDAPRRLAIGGRAGAVVKEQVCRYTLRAIRGRVA
ncbi:NADH dehydrogenase [Pseudonocardia sp. Ae168_Ps1]|uniref:FAD-dependent oxidoreductase n=1 Tax=unclassified Pseudonocardia TaxID=2619320 RepID=UPI00094AEF15|nr:MULTISPECIES: FAD-dependent oxidoreductase [unclassified Pseudonocardia]OLL74782.1 NADH dehydrogenase [Pseudonocardia sp. Ae150A_Ps1]OLL80774.1 NADH dehydrogenase [Pseudonocardia sp. Ae168_Ps1]OLL85108.1 NADH dehydrogenase [Pseudonocardia sp. Ae263_Ps1]OLL94875.1 NADH dehydrogenase [Pseudonocardia sp. Ae356_Ps1]